ncbi:hypothetical protein AB8B22_01385 [Leptotrichia sp. HSP-334]|jgi:hypothetical protein|uniref:YcxB-like protein domain-containing protein n=1 Tax=Leptotrichia rugosa TaxID=3239302 RepID=A0AB39VHA6_9FUSO|nr:hypothetical protein [Leptotrichia sp. oral taxon 498]ASQ47827.1 hypothetical protein BCB68_01880 [Leptotrichia sp. oral taxon 498]
MILKNYKYINLAYPVRLLIFLICISVPIILKFEVFIIGICFVVSVFIIFGTNACEKAIQKELNRRMSKLPVPKNQIFKWMKDSSIGYAFTDLSKGTIWICSTQTKFELHIYLISEFDIIESFEKIQFRKHSNTVQENELREFTIYKF